MEYFSLNYNARDISFLGAVRKGLAPDRGLYFPKQIPKLDQDFIDNLYKYSDHEIAYEVIKKYVGDDISNNHLKKIIEDTLNFNFPIIEITDKIALLELFHGPTLAFKDVGARFMARCLSYNNGVIKKGNLTVLVATSGDTGGAVADGFYRVKGIDVIILYPKGKISDIQERQLTTLGENITALEVDGTFDDCQEMVKNAFVDPELKENIELTSANSINIARWLSQMFYFFIAYKNRPNPDKKLVVSVPSGNFGNICAGIMAKQMGLPIHHFIASTNINDVVTEYLKSGSYNPKKSIQTISNAMDVGNPSNFIRIQKIFNNDFFKLKKKLSSFSYTDNLTKKALKEIYKINGYIADPHGAVGFLGLKEYLNIQEDPEAYQGIFLETAHPIKFKSTVDNILKTNIKLPERLQGILEQKKVSSPLRKYSELKSLLLSR
ncbi:threonine synthase [Flavobacteriaceae bacterium]|nr:threonine synthase [Flavobacteriaceae bacterium]